MLPTCYDLWSCYYIWRGKTEGKCLTWASMVCEQRCWYETCDTIFHAPGCYLPLHNRVCNPVSPRCPPRSQGSSSPPRSHLAQDQQAPAQIPKGSIPLETLFGPHHTPPPCPKLVTNSFSKEGRFPLDTRVSNLILVPPNPLPLLHKKREVCFLLVVLLFTEV